MRSSEEDDGSDIFENSCIGFVIVSINDSLLYQQFKSSEWRLTFFATSPPMLCATNIVGDYGLAKLLSRLTSPY